MKQTRLLVITIIAFLMLVLASGCGKTYELPWDQFCIKIDGNIEIVLSAEDKNYIIDLLNKGDWINDLGNCGCEYVFSHGRRRSDIIRSVEHLTTTPIREVLPCQKNSVKESMRC